jgi:hypothetical protein
MDISSLPFGSVSGPYYAGNTPSRQALPSACGYYPPDSFQRQNPDDNQQQQPSAEALPVDGPGMLHQLGHHLHV